MNKVVVITGASSGIGLTTGLYLIKKGYTVYSLSRSKKDNEIKYITCDVSNVNDIIEGLKEIYEQEHRIDVVINNAGMGIAGAIEDASSQDIDKIISVNMLGTFNVCKYAIPYLKETKGKIINISSVAGIFAIPYQAYYSVTKSAINSFTEALANEVKPYGIKATYIMPGDTKTEFTNNRVKTISDDNANKKQIDKSISKMEKDEQNGKNPLSVSKVIYKVIKKKNPPLKVTVGFGYKTLVFLRRILPTKFVNYIVEKIY